MNIVLFIYVMEIIAYLLGLRNKKVTLPIQFKINYKYKYSKTCDNIIKCWNLYLNSLI